MRTKIIMGIVIVLSLLWNYNAFAEYYVVASVPCSDCYRKTCHHHRYHHSHHSRYQIEKYYPCVVESVWIPSHCDCYGRCTGGYLQTGYIGNGNAYYAEPSPYDNPHYYKNPAIDQQFNQDMATGDDNALRCPDMNCQY